MKRGGKLVYRADGAALTDTTKSSRIRAFYDSCIVYLEDCRIQFNELYKLHWTWSGKSPYLGSRRAHLTVCN